MKIEFDIEEIANENTFYVKKKNGELVRVSTMVKSDTKDIQSLVSYLLQIILSEIPPNSPIERLENYRQELKREIDSKLTGQIERLEKKESI